MQLILQKISKEKSIPSIKLFRCWIDAVLKVIEVDRLSGCDYRTFEVVIRIVDEFESASLNYQYRKKNSPTNVLSFNFVPISSVSVPLILGDIVICAPIAILEAREQQKTIVAHFAHLTIHGVLHLLGFDHEKQSDAKKMMNLEIKILKELGYENPYIA